MAAKGSTATLSGIVDGMIKVIDDTRRLATKVPVDTSTFITVAFYLGELREALTHLNSKQQRADLASKNPEAHTGMKRLRGTLDKLQEITLKASNQSSRLLLIVDSEKVMSDLQRAVQEVGHDLNLVPVLSLMASSLPSDVANKLADLRTRMRAATFESEPEVLELGAAIDDSVMLRSKEKATDALAKVLKHFGASTNMGGSGNAEFESLQEEVSRDLRYFEKEQRWAEVGKLMDLKTFLGLASLSQEPPIVPATSRLAVRLQDSCAELAAPEEFKCSLTGEVMRDPVLLMQTQQTFDRGAVEAWFAKGKRSCPKTGAFLRSLELVPNVSLRRAIEESYDRLNEKTLQEAVGMLKREHELRQTMDAALQPNGEVEGESGTLQPQPQEEGTAGPKEVAGGAGEGAAQGAGGTDSREVEDPRRISLEEALEAMLQLTKLEPSFGLQAVEGGAVVPLVDLVGPTGLKAGDVLREGVLAILRNIASTGENAVLAMVEAGVISPIVKIISADSSDIATAVQVLRELSRVPAARQPITDEMGIVETIKLLSKHPEETSEIGKEVAQVLEMYWRDDPYVAIQMASVGMFKPLIELLGPGNDEETRLMMADGVMQWGVNKASRVTLVQGGVLPPLVDLLNSGSNAARAAAARSIEHLSHTDINRVALAKAGVIPALVKALSTGRGELRLAAQATLANLAMDDQDLDSLDEDGTAVRLITMLRTGQQTNRDYAIRTLECMARESKSIRAALMEDDGAIPAVFDVLREGPSHGFTAGSLRSTALLLLSHLCFELTSKEMMITTPEVVKALAVLLNRPIPQDEREAIAVVLATMVGNKRMRPLVRTEEHTYSLMHKLLQGASPKVQEKMMWGFAYIAERDESEMQQVLEVQQAVARLGIIPIAVKYLKMGPDTMRIPSTTLLGNLSLSSPSLSSLVVSDRKHARSKPWAKLAGSFSRSVSSSTAGASSSSSSSSSASGAGAGGSPVNGRDKVRSCKVHGGKCSLESTFCLVEGDLVGVLMELARRGQDKVAEVSLSAIASLLADDDDQERAAEYLVKVDVVEVAAGLVGRNKQLTKWAVYILERIFHFKKFRAEKTAQPAINALGRYMTTASGQERKMAAETIMRLNILPKGSIDGSL